MANEPVVNAGAAPVVESPAPEQPKDTNVGSPNAPGAGERSAPLMMRPDWVPEKFFKDGVIDYKGIATENKYLASKSGEPKVTEPKAGDPTPKVGEQKVTETQQSVNVPGVEQERVTAYTAEIAKDGKLSDASYAELATKGYNKATVDMYVAGLTRQAAIDEAVNDAKIAATEIQSITAEVGGQAKLTEMLTWAKSNLSAADLKAYNDSVSSSDPARVKLAVKGLHTSFVEQHGNEPNHLGGERLPSNPTGLQPYATEEEVTKDMSTREYKTSEEFRQKVAARLRVSPNVFTQSRDTTKVQR